MAATVIGNPYRVLRRALERAARDQREVRRAMAGTVKELIRDQFLRGVDPHGHAQRPRVDGKEAFISKKLPGAIKVTPTATGVEGTGELKDARQQWLDAHQAGHEFPSRASRGNRIAFNAAGERISIAKLKRSTERTTRRTAGALWWKKTTTTRTPSSKRITVGQRETYWQETKTRSKLRGRITNARAHTVGARVLPVRQIYPEGELGARWGGRIKTTVSATLRGQLERNVKSGGG